MHVRLLDLLREISECFETQSLPAAVIGGLAVNLHGYARSTLDQRRLRDLSDILELLKRHRASINMDEVRGYFRIFGREELLDELLRSIDPA